MPVTEINKLSSQMKTVFSKLSAYNAALLTQTELYDKLRRDAQLSFNESRQFWLSWEQRNVSDQASGREAALSHINHRVTGLLSLESQLKTVDKSYARRAETDFKTRALPDISRLPLDQYISRIDELFREAKQIATECSVTAHIAPIQELGMLFSGKRLQLYERFFDLVQEAMIINIHAEKAADRLSISVECDSKEKAENEIDRAALETAELIEAINERQSLEQQSVIHAVSTLLQNSISIEEIRLLEELSDLTLPSISNRPLSCCEFLNIGAYALSLSQSISHPEIRRMVERHFGSALIDGYLILPALFDRRIGANLCFDEGNSTGALGKDAIHRLIYCELAVSPASLQSFSLFNPGGSGKGYDTYLAFSKAHPEIMGGKVFTTQAQMREQIELLNSYINDAGQNQFVNYSDIFEYNERVADKPESLKTLCVLDFPKFFDAHMLESLLSIIRNGSSYGVNVLLQFSPNNIDGNMGDSTKKIVQQIINACSVFVANKESWNQDNVHLDLLPPLTQEELDAFDESFSIQLGKIKSAVLTIDKVLSKDGWFTGNTTKKLAIPFGKNEDGGIQYLEFGDAVGLGTSHYALLTGATGSGKSSLLHTLILNAITLYDPSELELYLLDFKSGTEFKIYEEYHIPHIKLLALDAMQEFGQSILEELWSIMQERVKLFAEVQDNDIKNITQYRQVTGRSLPRILVIMDEFQMLFNEENNRRIAYEVGAKMADFVSLARVYGIHFILSTQTMARLSSGFSIRKSTLNEMHVRIGLQSTEDEARSLFGDAYGKLAFNKMGNAKGTGVYVENDARPKLISFKGAYCDEEHQREILNTVERRYSMSVPTNTRVFRGAAEPDLSDCNGFINPQPDEIFKSVSIYLGEPIKIAPHVCINVSRMRRSNLLVVGSRHEMVDRIVALYILNALKTSPHLQLQAQDVSVYLLDGLSIMGEPMSELLSKVYSGNRLDIKKAESNFDVLPFLDEIYGIFEKRKRERASGIQKKYNTVHLVINGFQWIEPVCLVLDNKNVDEYKRESTTTKNPDLFSFLSPEKPSNPNDCSSLLDELISETSTPSISNQSPNKKLMTLLESSYAYGINIVLSCTDFLSVKERIYDVVPKFQNRIVFSLSNSDCDRLVQDAKTEGLKDNIVVFSDGINPAIQFKPFSSASITSV